MCGFQISKKGMKNKMDGKSYVLENIIQNYRIKDEEKVTSETIYQILENTRITIQELKKCLGIPKNTYVKLRKGEKCYFICRLCTNINNNRIRYKPEERKILKQYIKNEYLIAEDIKEMRKYITDDIRLMKILDISAEKYIKILNGKIKRIKNKIFDYQDKINIRNDIIKDTKNDNIITLKEVKKAKEDKTVIAVNAATPGVFGFDTKFRNELGKQYTDVGIAEEHAIAYSSALAKMGAKPILAIMTSFVQRTRKEYGRGQTNIFVRIPCPRPR